ncbi:hypothetical protein HY947_01145 [Candidatus Gottesmanbacteria bacterium]|nr:hypothetical protein [Candidatus Gottesmanbacteria bacterium]
MSSTASNAVGTFDVPPCAVGMPTLVETLGGKNRETFTALDNIYPSYSGLQLS